MGLFRLEITTDNAAFGDGTPEDREMMIGEIIRILRDVHEHIDYTDSLYGTIRDANGNTCGAYSHTGDDE